MAVVIGDIILDMMHSCKSTRIAQEATIPIANIESSTPHLGGAGYVYANLKSLGCDAHIIPVIGAHFKNSIQQTHHNILLELLDGENIIYDPTRCVTVKDRYYVNNKIVFRCDDEMTHSISMAIQHQVLSDYLEYCSHNKIKVLVLSDYNKGVVTEELTAALIKVSRVMDIKVFIDPKKRNIYQNCFLIKPNQLEGEYICGHNITSHNWEASVKEICQITHSKMCLLTLGENGMALYDGNNSHYFPIEAEANINIIGAGDIVLSSLVHYFIKTNYIYDAVKFSNYCGRLKVMCSDVKLISPYDELLFEHKLKKNKVIYVGDINTLKRTHKSIVATNGCFDVLHIGHYNLLEHAKQLGDILVVCINSDQSVTKLKGETRPINCIDRRCKQLSMLNCVDHIIVYDEDTPYELYKLLTPDVLVKGSDYKLEQIIGREFAQRVEIFDLVEGMSTTRIVSML